MAKKNAEQKATEIVTQIKRNLADLNAKKITGEEFHTRNTESWKAARVAGPKTDDLVCAKLMEGVYP